MNGTEAAFTIVAATAVASVAALVVTFMPPPASLWGQFVWLLGTAVAAVVTFDWSGRVAGRYRSRAMRRRLRAAGHPSWVVPVTHRRTGVR